MIYFFYFSVKCFVKGTPVGENVSCSADMVMAGYGVDDRYNWVGCCQGLAYPGFEPGKGIWLILKSLKQWWHLYVLQDN